YVKPTAKATAEKLSLGAVLDVSKNGKHVTTLTTYRGFYPAQDPSLGIIGRFFGGESDSTVGLRAGITKDIWTVINPDLTPLQNTINRGDATFTKAMQGILKLPPAQQQTQLNTLFQLRDAAIS